MYQVYYKRSMKHAHYSVRGVRVVVLHVVAVVLGCFDLVRVLLYELYARTSERAVGASEFYTRIRTAV